MTIHIPFRTIMTLSLLTIIVFSSIWHRGKLINTSERDKSLDIKKEKLLNCEQYSLRALTSDFYPCTHCRKKLYWVNAHEVIKYGITCDPNSRYTDKELSQKKAYYFREFRGNLYEVSVMEAEKLFLFYKHPQNITRPESERISLPVLNLQDN